MAFLDETGLSHFKDKNDAVYAAKSHSHTASQINGLTASRAMVSDASGHPSVSAITSTELGYLDGVTSSIQTQLNNKAASSHNHKYAGSSTPGGAATVADSVSGLLATADAARHVWFSDSATETKRVYNDNFKYNPINNTITSHISGNAASATKLKTARTINGTSFDGSANITTANWGNTRTLTIGNAGKSVNGSANVSWSLSEIGAAASSHTHSYLPLSGGTLTGSLTPNGGISYVGNEDYIDYPGGGSFTTTSASITGYIKVILPVSWNNTMIKFKIAIYDYSSNNGADYFVSGYNYSTNSSWTNCTAYSIGDGNISNLPVIFGHDGSKCLVAIGSATTTWHYPQITVSDVTLGFNGGTYASFKTGWDVVVNNTAISNVDVTISNPLHGKGVFAESSHSHNYAGSSSAGGAANSAVALTTNAGSSKQPVYFSGGKPVAIGYTIEKSVPANAVFTDTNTTYSQATSSTLGLIKIGFPESGKNYPVELNTSGQAYVNVPWTDTNTTYTLGSFGITATAAEINHLDGITATVTELNYCDGVTSNIQTQLNGKAASSHTHAATQVTGLTASRALVSDGNGHPAVSAVTSTELGYLDGVTSSIQTQLNGKAASSHNHSASNITSGTLPVSRGGTGVTSDAAIGLKAYPVGSVYIAYTSTSPASRFGGTWTQITGRFIRAAADVSTGGADRHTLSVSEMPKHRHASPGERWVWEVSEGTGSGEFDIPRSSANRGNADWYSYADTGGGKSHNNMPAYQDLYVWRRTA